MLLRHRCVAGGVGTMAQQAKLMAGLKKKAEDDDAPRPQLAPSEPTADMGTLKLRKSTLTGAITWEAMVEKLDLNTKHAFDTMSATLTKMLTSVCDNPTEPKYRRSECVGSQSAQGRLSQRCDGSRTQRWTARRLAVNSSNANFRTRAYDCTGVPELFTLCGFKDEAGFLVLAENADLAPLRRAVDALVRPPAGSNAQTRTHGVEIESSSPLQRTHRLVSSPLAPCAR
jgi:hypothetical protein